MLNPCSARKWVVIALPEDIKVDAVSLSNHELFASAVREWQLVGSMKYPTELWSDLGKFEAADSKQVRRSAHAGRQGLTRSCAGRRHRL